jgi:hypothetical protein
MTNSGSVNDIKSPGVLVPKGNRDRGNRDRDNIIEGNRDRDNIIAKNVF